MSDMNNTINENLNDELSQIRLIIITALLSAILFISLTGQSIVIPVFPLYKKIYGGGAFQLGLLIGFYSLTSIILAPFIGSLADKYGRKLFLILGLVFFALANILYVTAQSFNQLLLYRIIEGSTAAGAGAIVNALLVDIIPPTKRAKYLGIANGSGFFGIVMGPFIGSMLVVNNNMALPFEVTSVVAGIGIVLAYIILPNDYEKFKSINKEKTVKKEPVLEKINFTHWLVTGGTVAFVLTILVRITGLMSWNIFQPTVPIYLYGLHYSSVQVGVFFSFLGVTTFVGQLLLSGLSDKYGRRIIMQIGIFVYLVAYLIMIHAINIILFYVAGVVAGIGFALLIPAIVAQLADLAKDPIYRGKVMGVYFGVFYLAGVIGPVIGGYLGSIFSFEIVLFFVIVVVISELTFSLLIKPVKNNGDYENATKKFINFNSAD